MIPSLTATELIETLKRSTLPTLLVEGTTDAAIYRHIEDQTGVEGLDVMSCGGREKLLEVARRREELVGSHVAFLADKDFYLFAGIPDDLASVIWTTGYSIENDLYADTDIERLLTSDESREHKRLLLVICDWFSWEVEEFLGGREPIVDIHVNRIVPLDGDGALSGLIRTRISGRGSDPGLRKRIVDSYQLCLRGKQLFSSARQVSLGEPPRSQAFAEGPAGELCKDEGTSSPCALVGSY